MAWIYILLLPDKQLGPAIGPTIKIGWTGQTLEQRLSQEEYTQTSYNPYKFLAAIKADANSEYHLHAHFQDARVTSIRQKEIFQPTPSLTNYIRWLRKQYYVLLDPNSSIEIDRVPYSVWQPTPDRISLPPSLPLQAASKAYKPNWLDFPEPSETADDFFTKPWIIECARTVLGTIDLDPASCAAANKSVQAKDFYTERENGLLQPWYGRMWLNGPFTNYQPWIDKLLEEWPSKRIEAICVYCKTRALTASYFQRLMSITTGLCIIDGRPGHDGLGLKGTGTPLDGNCVFYAGTEVSAFAAAFKHIGRCWVSA